jgi:hypothetical protein
MTNSGIACDLTRLFTNQESAGYDRGSKKCAEEVA